MSNKLIFEIGRALLAVTPGDVCTFYPDFASNGLHSHHIYELSYVLSGKGSFICGEKAFRLQKGDIFVADPGLMHEITRDSSLSKKAGLQVYYLTFHIEYPESWTPSGPEEKILYHFLQAHHFWKSDCPQLACYLRFLKDYAACSKKDIIGIRCAVSGFVINSLEYLNSQSKLPVMPIYSNHIVDDAISYIAFHFTEKITLDQLSAHCNTSVRNLQHTFRLQMHCTITEYITQVRLNQACCYLRMSEKISTACMKSGIPNPAQFSRLFRKQYGITPSEYQKKYARLSSYVVNVNADPVISGSDNKI